MLYADSLTIVNPIVKFIIPTTPNVVLIIFLLQPFSYIKFTLNLFYVNRSDLMKSLI